MAVAKTGKELPQGIMLRKDGRYIGRFKYLGDTYTVYGKTVEETQEKLDDLKYETRHGLYEKETNLTVDAWFRTWMEQYKESTVKQGTVNLYFFLRQLHSRQTWKIEVKRCASRAYPKAL